MMVGTTGIDRVVQRTVELMRRARHRGGRRARRHPAGRDPEVPELPLLGLARPVRRRRPRPTWRTTTPPGSRAAGWRSGARTTTSSTDDAIMVDALRRRRDRPDRGVRAGRAQHRPAPRVHRDCEGGVKRWNKILDDAGLSQRLDAAARWRSTARSARSPAIEATPDGEKLSGRGVGAAQGRLAADRRRQDARAVADAAGARARQDRRLDRPAAAGHQRPAVRLRLRAPGLSRS